MEKDEVEAEAWRNKMRDCNGADYDASIIEWLYEEAIITEDEMVLGYIKLLKRYNVTTEDMMEYYHHIDNNDDEEE